MIKSEQIPDEVAEAFIATLYGEPGLPYRKAIAAAINAWPNGEVRPPIQKPHDTAWYPPYISLPLLQEPRT